MEFKSCPDTKVWEFEDEDSYFDACEPPSEISEKFGNITATKAAEDSITDCLKEKTSSWKDIYDVMDAGLEK